MTLDSPATSYFLESSLPTNIYKNFLKLNTSIPDFFKSLPILSVKQTKKLKTLTSNKNIKSSDLIPLTLEKDRNVRTLATLCCLNKMNGFLVHAKGNREYETDVMQIYDDVFMRRSKDIDFNIRAMCYEHLCDSIVLSDLFKRKEFYKPLVDALMDKNDTVRRKAIKGCVRVYDKLIKNGQKTFLNAKSSVNSDSLANTDSLKMNNSLVDAKPFVNAVRDKVYIRCTNESNAGVKREALGLLIKFYRNKFTDKEEIFTAISNFDSGEYEKLYCELKEESGCVKALEELYDCDPDSLKKLTLSNEDRNQLMDFVDKCDESILTHLDILVKTMSGEYGNISALFDLIRKYRHSVTHIRKIVEMMNAIDSNSFKDSSSDLIEYIIEVIVGTTDNDTLSGAFLFLKKVYEHHKAKIDFFIENIRYLRNKVLVKYAIRSFDVSEVVDDGDELEVKVLAYLWKVKNFNPENYASRNEYNVKNLENEVENNSGKENRNSMKGILQGFKETDKNFITNSGNDLVNDGGINLMCDSKSFTGDNIEIKAKYNSERDLKLFNYEIQSLNDLREASNYLLYFYEILDSQNSLDIIFELAYDPISSIKIIYDELKKNLTLYFRAVTPTLNKFDFKEAIKRKKGNSTEIDPVILHSHAKIAHITHTYDLLFYSSSDDILSCLEKLKLDPPNLTSSSGNPSVSSFVDSFFHSENIPLTTVKQISIFLSKKYKNLQIYHWLLTLSNKTNFYDNCYVYFVKYLSCREAGELIKTVSISCRYKKELEKRIKEGMLESGSEDAIRI